MLVSCRQKDGLLNFEVHKQGLLMLRNFRNKRLRVIFNITHDNKNIQQFNRNFLSKTQQQTLQPPIQTQQKTTLYISKYYKQLSDNRILIFLNAYAKQFSTHLLVIGYLVASVFFYHNPNQLTEDSHLTKMLSKLKQLLESTQINQLEQEVKYKSGCSKKPYFMCLFQMQQNKIGNHKNLHQVFREFYKYQEGKNQLNQSVDAFIDYFPERSAIMIGDYTNSNQQSTQKIKKLGQEYLQKILGRQIFNFQITGSTLQNICFQLCQIFNKKQQSIDLLKIYTKIITNKKTQVLDLCTQKYYNLTNQLCKNLPYQPSQLLQHYYNIQKYIIRQSIEDACNCMIFSEYVTIYEKLMQIMDKKYKSIIQNNKQLLRNKIITCYQTIEDDQQFQQNLTCLNQSNAAQLLQAIQQKINIFIQQTINQFNTKDLLSRLINKNINKLSQTLQQYLTKKQQTQQQLITKINKLQIQNKTYNIKCRQLQNQFIYLHSVNNQYKQKLLSMKQNVQYYTSSLHNIGNYNQIDNIIYCDMKKKIMELQEQLINKNQSICNLMEILDKFDIEFNRKYSKHKFNKDVQTILSEISQKINDLHDLFSNLKKTQQYYQDIQLSFENKKKQFNQKRAEQRNKLLDAKQQITQMSKQKSYLQQTVQQSRKVIKYMRQAQEEYKNMFNQLQNGCSSLKCMLAEAQRQLQQFKKALQLTTIFNITGKIQKLQNFYKISKEDNIKQILKPLFKK